MKVLSLWQPWATLVVIGAKQFETRSWPTSYRGPLLIHAAKHFTAKEREICLYDPFRSVLDAAGYVTLSSLPLGQIIGMVEVVDCSRTESLRGLLLEQERAFGNYADDRFAHRYADPVRFTHPLPFPGRQGYFNCDVDLKGLL